MWLKVTERGRKGKQSGASCIVEWLSVEESSQLKTFPGDML